MYHYGNFLSLREETNLSHVQGWHSQTIADRALWSNVVAIVSTAVE